MYFVIQVETRKELDMEKKISSYPHEGIFDHVFAPRRKRLVKYLGSWHEVTDVLFPGYLFIKTNKPDAVKLILNDIEGYTKILCSFEKDHFAYIPLTEEEEQMIDTLYGGENKEIEISIVDVVNKKIVKVISGPLKQFENNIVEVDLHKRLAKVETSIATNKKYVYFGISFNKVSGNMSVLDVLNY